MKATALTAAQEVMTLIKATVHCLVGAIDAAEAVGMLTDGLPLLWYKLTSRYELLLVLPEILLCLFQRYSTEVEPPAQEVRNLLETGIA